MINSRDLYITKHLKISVDDLFYTWNKYKDQKVLWKPKNTLLRLCDEIDRHLINDLLNIIYIKRKN